MVTKGKTTRKSLSNTLGNASKKFGQASISRAQASKIRAEGKATKRMAKAEVIRARQGIKKTQARSAAIATVAASASQAYKQNAAQSQLSEWIKGINGTSEPAEGTGEPSTGEATPAPKTTGDPVGNYVKVI